MESSQSPPNCDGDRVTACSVSKHSRIAKLVQWLRAVAAKASSIFRLFYCAGCRKAVTICSRCDRGNIYCSAECRGACQRRDRRAAALRYQKTPCGSRNHAKRQFRYRARKQKVTHSGSNEESALADCAPVDSRVARECCHFCGRFGNGFVRFGYIRTLERKRLHDKQRARGRNFTPLLC